MSGSQTMFQVSVILPTYNERENIGPLIAAIHENVPEPTQIIVVDDDSPDRTWQAVEEIAKADGTVQLLRRVGRKGLTSAIAEGINLARGEVIVWMDCDFSMPPEVIPTLLKALKKSDVAVGSRYVAGGQDAGHSLIGQLFSRTINLFASLLLGFAIRDYTSGFIAARRKVLDDIGLRGDYGEYCIDLLYRARTRGYQVVEVPYRCLPRRSGQSKTAPNFWGFFRHGWKYVVTIIGLRFGY
ncbi:MAG: polyprenol monophosphomannose synthase [Anaerolineae bacterium]